MGRSNSACSGLYTLLALLQVIVAVVAAVLVGTKLDDVTVSFQGGVQVNDPQGGCGLGSFNSAQSLCTYTILTCAITAGAALLLAVLMCCTCNFCGMGKYFTVIVSGLGTAWWVITAGVVQSKVNGAPSDGLGSWRTAVVVLIWVEAGLFAAQTAAGMVWVCRSGKNHDYEDMEVGL